MTDPSKYKSRTYTALPSQPLADSDIHIWCVSLNVSPQDLSYYRSILSKDEVNRAGRFVFEKDRDHYIAGRGLLRVILGSYLDLEPAQLEFVYGPHGKPALKPGPTDKALEFNLSHSKDLALYAFNWNRRIGIDIEYIIPMADMDNFAEQFFTRRETALINVLSGHQKEDAFFRTWTCKEAFLKANGSGLTVPINQVEISLDTDEVVTLSSIGNNKEQTSHWHLEILNHFPGYRAALAVEGRDVQVKLQQLTDNFI
jgi:4'-phosphopantetheinyl transferase